MGEQVKKNPKRVVRNSKITANEAVKIGKRVTWIGFWVNAFLGLIKVLGDILGRSSALVADGIHSFSDFFSDIIVIMMVGVARRRPNKSYQFGHGRFEALATVLLSLILAIVAIGIFYEGVVNIIGAFHGVEIPKPSVVAIIIILISILSKEWLYHFTRRTGERIHSDVVIANAWHHRSDSFSSIATLVGVGGAMFLGEKWRILDPIAAIIVGIFIVVVSVKLASPAIKEMLGISISKEDRQAVVKALKETPGVLGWHHLQTFKSGYDGYVIVHIKVDPDISVKEAHEIATQAERNMHSAVSDLSIHASTHIEPYEQLEKPKKRNGKK